MKRYLSILVFILFCKLSVSQSIFQPVSDKSLYEFIDELANLQLIEINSAIKPYSRQFIFEKLMEADKMKNNLNKRQQNELAFYLKEFSLENQQLPVSYKTIYLQNDSLKISLIAPEASWKSKDVRILFRPVYGIRFISNEKDKFYASYGGLEAQAYVGKNWSFYASLRDNYQNKYILAKPGFFTQEMGGNYKINEGGRKGGDFSEMRGGITYTWNWGDIALIKDHVQWGDNYNGSNIFSGRTPSFAMIKLHMKPAKWFDFNYYHGWLVSEVIDSTNSYITLNGDFRAVYRNKYIAANMFTFTPWRNFNFSMGNSIVYSDMPVQAAYLIPFMFFKSIDHTINHSIDNQNSQMYFNISSRNIKHLHLYLSYFVDEFSVNRITDSKRTNFTSTKVGFRLSNFMFNNYSLTTEFTQTMPITYKHRVESTTFETNQFNLGHYLRDNSQEIYIAAEFKPYKTLKLKISYLNAFHANEYKYFVKNSILKIDELPVLQDKTWSNQTIEFTIDFRPWQNTSIFASYTKSNIKAYNADGKTAQYYLNLFTPEYLQGENNTFTFGFAYGFQ